MYDDVAGVDTKSFTKVKVNSVDYSPFVHQSSHIIAEGYQIGQACSSLCKSLLTSPYHLLVCSGFHVLKNAFQKDFLYHLPETEVRLACSSWICSFLLEDGSDISSLPVIRSLS